MAVANRTSPSKYQGKTQQLHRKLTVDAVEGVIAMPRGAAVALFVVVLIAVIVGVDLLFLRDHFWARLLSNIGIVLVFAAFGLRFLKKP